EQLLLDRTVLDVHVQRAEVHFVEGRQQLIEDAAGLLRSGQFRRQIPQRVTSLQLGLPRREGGIIAVTDAPVPIGLTDHEYQHPGTGPLTGCLLVLQVAEGLVEARRQRTVAVTYQQDHELRAAYITDR